MLDIICDGLKRESTARYVESIFDRYVAPNSFDDKVEIIRQLLAHFASVLPRALNAQRPEQYANDYKQLVRAIVDGLRRIAREARR